jgi:peroxiredoxin family protein
MLIEAFHRLSDAPGGAVKTKRPKKCRNLSCLAMDKAHIPSLTELLEMAQIEGVELIVCRMTLDMME